MVAFTKADKEKVLKITQKDVEDGNLTYFKVDLEEPIKAGERVIVNVEATFVKILKPYPKYIEQNDDQYVLFETNVYYLSPYDVTKQKTTFKIGDTIKSYSKEPEPVKEENDDVYYGPYENIKPGTERIVSLHYKLKDRFIHFESIERTIEISHWCHTVSFKEDLVVHHDGSELKNNFNRIAFQKSQFYTETPSSVKDMIFVLPPRAEDIFFVDIIGNVSTSAFHKDNTRTLLQVLPRYPLFGGWKYTWSQGYNNPLDGNVKYNSKIKKYIFQAPILLSLKNVPIDHFKLNVVLPEGVRNVEVHLPYAFDSDERKMTYSYLDTTGRPTIVLEKDNVCDDHFQYFQISYSLPFYFSFQKPLVVALVIFTLFVISMVWTRIDLSIVKDPRADLHDLAVSYWESVAGDTSTAQKVLSKLTSVNETFIQNRNKEAYDSSVENVSEKLEESINALNRTQDLLEDIEQQQLVKNIKKLIDLIKDKKDKINDKGKRVLNARIRIERMDAETKEAAEKELLKKEEIFDQEIKDIDSNIESIVNTQIL
jgi:oligosaccharyltransferase complex subunit alpha (ribophorin I)